MTTATMAPTSQLLEEYYERLARRSAWEELVADDICFIGPNTRTDGKAAFIRANHQFVQGVRSFEVKQRLSDGNTACAWVTYQLVSPKGTRAELDVVEIWRAADGKLDQMTIYFDTAAFRGFMQS